MPLHDLSYQRFDGSRTTRLTRSLALARTSVALLLKRRTFLLLLGLCWIPVIVRAAQIYVARQFPQAAPFLEIDALLWQEFLSHQVALLPVILVALYTGAGAIAADLATGASVVFLSKPISRLDYVIGKAVPVLGAILVVTLVPALALLALHLVLAENFDLLRSAPLLPLSVIGFSLWMSLYFTLTVLAVSSLSRSARVAGAGFGALALGSKIVFLGALTRLRFNDPPAFLSMMDASVDAGHLFFGNTVAGNAPLRSLVAMTVTMVVAIVVLRWRLRSVEVSS